MNKAHSPSFFGIQSFSGEEQRAGRSNSGGGGVALHPFPPLPPRQTDSQNCQLGFLVETLPSNWYSTRFHKEGEGNAEDVYHHRRPSQIILARSVNKWEKSDVGVNNFGQMWRVGRQAGRGEGGRAQCA